MCDENCELVKKFVREYSDPLYAEIGEWDNYFTRCDKDARNAYRKAGKLFTVRKLDYVDDRTHGQILSIYISKDMRQRRPVNFIYHMLKGETDIREEWPYRDYKSFTCPRHYMDFYGCYDGERLIAFIELLHSGELTTVYSVMGHADYLKKGVMKYLILEVIKLDKVKFLHYGNSNYSSPIRHFLKDLCITQTNPTFIYKLAAK